ncbi:hypothetical protein [Salinibacterium sp.]|uniref:hypothetical protein n=1 Tax=Salinibacterium sp. TaxID=1915057 RepID=UPI00286C1D8D|nr:hypothetical protein [Salinibacterium sp.]
MSHKTRTGGSMLAGAAFLITVLLAGATPASAHGGEIVLSLSQDGGGGLQVVATRADDGHPVEDVIDPVLTATSAEGESVGPLALVPSEEGIGVWQSPKALLAAGEWTVTVSITMPSQASVTEQMTVVITTDQVPADGSDGIVLAPTTEAEAVGPPVLIVAGASVLGIGALAAAVVLFRRRRQTSVL